LIRQRPLEVKEVVIAGKTVRIPTLEEMTRIKAWLVLRRNAVRDYLDLVALAKPPSQHFSRYRSGRAAPRRARRSARPRHVRRLASSGSRRLQQPARALAERIVRLCEARDMYGTSRLWPAFIVRVRGGQQREPSSQSLADVRRRAGKTQSDVAQVLGISQSDVSKLERRGDIRISTLRRYVAALGAELEVRVRLPRARRAVALDLEGRR
jgi:DNA-binding XRE family transcriptional regulator